tara:strand:+ start:1361 stop:3256 length:1896 start_codon:yes stop_codon:yes gene_type:complete
MIRLIVVFLLACMNTAFCQVVGLSPYSDQSNFRLKKADQIIDTLSLPFIEDFSSDIGNPDSLKFYNLGGVFINNNFGAGNRSRNVATFDGLDEFGIPYDQIPPGGNPNTISNGDADYLLSKPINLAGLTKEDSVVFSFWWQKGSVSDVLGPELEEGDSLSLFFLDEDSIWVKVWPIGISKTNVINAVIGSAFQSDSVNLVSNEFLHGGFQFMFTSHGTLTGNFDVWNINHLYLDSKRADEYVNDYSFGEPLTSLLNNYRAMPYEQFIEGIEAQLSDDVIGTFYNSNNINTIILDSFFIIRDTVSGVEIEKVKTNFNPNFDGGIIINSLSSFDAVYAPDKLGIAEAILDIDTEDQFIVLETSMSAYKPDLIDTNNTQSTFNVLDNYYAYDDGTAEVGFGIVGTGGFACKFELVKGSTLKSLDLHFVRSGVDNDYSTINLKVWKSIKGVDGATTTEVLVTTRVSVILDDFELNKFYNYEFSTPIELDAGVFYVGWEQVNIASRYVIGFDLSRNNIDKIYTFKNSAWGQDFTDLTKGSAMIRPYFGDKRVTSLIELPEEINVEFYPNPVRTSFKILMSDRNIIGVDVLDINGVLVIDDVKIENKSFIVDLADGVYIALITTNKGIVREKFVVIR